MTIHRVIHSLARWLVFLAFTSEDAAVVELSCCRCSCRIHNEDDNVEILAVVATLG